MATGSGKLNVRDIRRRFDRIATRFDDADDIHRAAFDGLIERLSPVVLAPREILDLGSATGSGSRQLAKRYRGSRIISLDTSFSMLAEARRGWRPFSRIREVQADAARIPLRDACMDLVFANLLLPWIHDLPACLTEVARVLREGGLFAFSTLGAASLAELRQAWLAVDREPHVHGFPDMHDVGDAMLQAGLQDPVLDVDTLKVTFPGVDEMLRDLSACGARNCLAERRPTLTGKGRFRRMQHQLESGRQEGRLSLGLELVYGHAWGAGPLPAAGEYRVSPQAIGRRRGR